MSFSIPDFAPAVPEIFVLCMACTILIAELYFGDRWKGLGYTGALATLVGAAILTLDMFSDASVLSFNGMFIVDPLADTLKLALYAVVFVVFVYSRQYIQARGMYRGEYFVLGLFGVLGMMVMISANHLLTLYLGLELLALCLYTMVALRRDSERATEAAMKYFVLGALASGMLLYGMSMLYGATGTLQIDAIREAISRLGADNLILTFGLVFVVAGIAFKLGAVPFHMWVPDVYDGAPTSVTLYIGSAPKLAAFAMVMRLLVGGLDGLVGAWQDMLIILAVLSIGIGNVIAIAQSNIKRMLAYSTISHMGYFLLGVIGATPNGYSSAMFYVLIYAFMSLGGFGMVILLSRAGFECERLDDFRGLNQRSPGYALLMLLLMFSMAGVPPTVGFYAKLAVIQSLVDVGMIWLAVVAVVLAVVGAYYYLRVVKLMYFDAPDGELSIEAGMDMRVLIGINAIGMVAVLPWVGVIFDLCAQAVKGLS
jgi:NADH-quinone oxidoreductase subunit N